MKSNDSLGIEKDTNTLSVMEKIIEADCERVLCKATVSVWFFCKRDSNISK